MKIEDKKYSIEILPETNTVVFCGNLRMNTVNEYNEIMENIFTISKESDKSLILDFSKLEFINSSGLASLGILFIKLRDYEKKIRIVASKYVNWHVASLKDYQTLNSQIEIEYIVQH